MKPHFKRTLVLALLLITGQGLCQESGKHGADYTYAEGSPTYWRGMHSTRKGNFVFQRDASIWVYTKEIAERVGMPLEWASDELKGVAAAAFRMEEDPLGENCGWGGNPKACKPEKKCVLDLYFDRQAHPLPWDMKRQVADFDWQSIATAYHFLPANGFAPAPNGDRSRGSLKSPNYPSVGARSPFIDSSTGDELGFANQGVGAAMKVVAYDREIHSRYAFVRLQDSCGRSKFYFPNGKPQVIELRRAEPQNISKKPPVFYEIRLPYFWLQKIESFTDTDAKQTELFYQQIWNELNKGDQK